MSYSREDKDKAFILYKELRSATRVSGVLNIPEPTISKWRDKYGWYRLIKSEERALIAAPYDQTEYIKDICNKFNIGEQDGEVLSQVKTIEGICLATIKGETELLAEDGLTPPNFDSAIKALKICWETRDKIFHKDPKSPAGDVRYNYIGAVNQFHYGNKGDQDIADNSIPTSARAVLVCEQEENSERDGSDRH